MELVHALPRGLFQWLADRDMTIDGTDVIATEYADAGGFHDPPRWIAPMHVHHRDDEAWYVLEGKLFFIVDGMTFTAGPGEAVLVPHGAAHAFRNALAEQARYILVTPPSIRAILEELEGPGGRSDAELEALFARHDGEFLGWPDPRH